MTAPPFFRPPWSLRSMNQLFLMHPGAHGINFFHGLTQIFYAADLRRRGQIDHFCIVVVNLRNLSNLWIASRRDFDASRRARDKLLAQIDTDFLRRVFEAQGPD